MHVSLCIATWNDARYLPELFASIRAQSYPHITVRLFDNGSADGETVPYILREEPRWLAGRSTKHIGTAGAKNTLVRMALERFHGDIRQHVVLLAESNTVWHPEMIATLVHALEERADIDAVQPKILRAFSERGDMDADAVQSDILDSTGGILPSGVRIHERGAGDMDNGQFDANAEDILLTNGIMMIRASALSDVMIDNKAFDEALGHIAEDHDIALRFVRCGHRTRCVPFARAHRYRGFATELRDARAVFPWVHRDPSRLPFTSVWNIWWKQWTLQRIFFDRTLRSLQAVRAQFRRRT